MSAAFRFRMSVLAVPSMVFRQTLPVNPSVTTTSKSPAMRSPPSQFPAKAGTVSDSRRWASWANRSPLVSSSPMFRRPTFGRSTPMMAFMYTSPIWANCTRYSGLQSALAPTSMSRVGRAASRNDLAQSRALHAFDAPDDERGRGQAGAGGTGGEETIGGALLHEPAAHDDGGVLLGAHGAGRMLPHLDDLGGHLRRRPIVNGGEGLHLLGRPDEREPQVGIGLKGLQGAAQHHGRAAVTAHDVHGDCYWFCHVAYLLKTMRRPGRQGHSLHGHCASGPTRTACGHGRRHGPIAKKPPGRPGLSSLACEEALPTSRRLPGASATVTHKSYSVSMTSRSR